MYRASDERQYCSPGIDLPMCSFSRSLHFKEYHTNKDNLKIVSPKNLLESLEVLKNIVVALELGLYPKTRILCEPNMGRRGLYPLISKKNNHTKDLKLRMDIIAYCDGNMSIFDIAKKLKTNLSVILDELFLLKSKNLISINR